MSFQVALSNHTGSARTVLFIAALACLLTSAQGQTTQASVQGTATNSGSQASSMPLAAPSPTPGNSQGEPSSGGPNLQMSPTLQMKSLEPAEDEEYTLGGGDEISVEVPGHPELSGKHTVGPDGRITLPTAGTVNLNDLSREQASRAVEAAYGNYYRNVTASIGIEKYGSNRVMVTGAVLHQGYVYFQQTPTLLDAITQAGLAEPTALHTGVQTATTGRPASTLMPQECTVYETSGGKQMVVTVNLRKMLTSNNAMADLRLRRNAVIYVPNPRDRFVSVLGEVAHSGPVQLTDEINLPTLIAAAGGITDHAGNNPNIAVVDPTTRKTRYIRYKDMLTPNQMNEVSLQPGDLIVVPKAGLAKVGSVFQEVSPITGLAGILAVTAF